MIKVNNPLLASKIDSNVQALDGDTLERYAIILKNVTSGNVYDTLADARTAVVSWFLDERTPKTAGNISKLNKLIIDCRQCERLVNFREKIATEKRKQYIDEENLKAQQRM